MKRITGLHCDDHHAIRESLPLHLEAAAAVPVDGQAKASRQAARPANRLLSKVVLLAGLLWALATPTHLFAAGPEPVDLGSTANFVILSGAAITTTGGGPINGDVGASPIDGAAIGVTCPQVTGIIYAVDASGPECAVIHPSLLTTAKGDLTVAFNDAAGRTPVPTGPFLNPNGGNIGGLNLVPGLYKFTSTALVTGSDVTLTGGPDDVWIFQIAADLQVGSGISVILAGGAQARNIFWQVGTSAVLDTFSSFKGTILADQAITMRTSSTLEGRALAFEAGVTFNGFGATLPLEAPEPEPIIEVEQPPGVNIPDGGGKDFGSVTAGGNTSLTFTIKNTGDADLTGLGITLDGVDSDLFTVTASATSPVAPGSDTTFTVRFAPLDTGLKTAALRIANNDADRNPFDIALSGTGTAVPEPVIVVEQPLGEDIPDGGSKDFGSVVAGGNTSLTFTIKNTGDADLTDLGITFDGADADLFTVTASATPPVSPGSDTTFTVRFAPLDTGLKTAALRIANNDADRNPFDIALSGTGTAVPEPVIVVEQPSGTNIADGGSKDFGSVVAGGNTSLTFTIKNTGDADLTGLGITFDGADAALFTVTSNATSPVSPGGDTTFTVRFAPVDTGLKTAVLRIANNDADRNPFDIALSGTGTAVPEPVIVVEQPLGTNIPDGGSKHFGSVTAGSTSSLTFIIKNTGDADLTGLDITLDGADAALFTVTASATSPVGPGGGTTFTVRFAPVDTGLKTAALHIANNDTDRNPFDIALSGTGTAVPEPIIVVEQPSGTNIADGGSKDFGSVVAGDNTSLIFTIKNTGDADLTGLGITLDGADAALFTVTASATSPVGPGAGTTFTVRFAPVDTGSKTAALHIANNDADRNPFDIALSGTGTAVPAPEIVVEQPLGVNIPNNGSKDFGPVPTGSSSSLSFTVKNTGDADLTGLVITVDGADAAFFTVTVNPSSPVGPGGGTAFTVRFAPIDAGPKTAALHIASNDGDENPFNITLTGFGAPVLEVTIESALVLNPQTGLFEQTIRLTNLGSVTVPALRFLLQDLPADVEVYNASGSLDGIPFVQYSLPLAPAASVDLAIEYFRSSRVAIPPPTLVPQVIAPVVVTETGTVVASVSAVQLAGGRFLIDFSTTPGRRYTVQYSSDLENWKTAEPVVTAAGNRVQWLDDGPPKTETLPADLGSRFYRIMELP